ncbi:hypothetical protein KC353_g75 [Hortaea werneckii]|nr:hypothetical protein KC353_g75 [Hortaea werneckii]
MKNCEYVMRVSFLGQRVVSAIFVELLKLLHGTLLDPPKLDLHSHFDGSNTIAGWGYPDPALQTKVTAPDATL